MCFFSTIELLNKNILTITMNKTTIKSDKIIMTMILTVTKKNE